MNNFDVNIFLKSILFTDIETVAITNSHAELDKEYVELWDKQCKQSYSHLLDKGKTSSELWKEKAAIHPEFAKIVTIGMGYLVSNDDNSFDLRIKTLSDKDETVLLKSYSAVLAKAKDGNPIFTKVCAHNGKRFDFPFLFRRYLINSIQIPDLLDTRGKKPWDLPNIDTMELWAGGGTSYPSLDLLCKVFNLPLKTGLDGSQVHDTYYQQNDLPKISKYCAGDISALVNLVFKIYEISAKLKNTSIL